MSMKLLVIMNELPVKEELCLMIRFRLEIFWLQTTTYHGQRSPCLLDKVPNVIRFKHLCNQVVPIGLWGNCMTMPVCALRSVCGFGSGMLKDKGYIVAEAGKKRCWRLARKIIGSGMDVESGQPLIPLHGFQVRRPRKGLHCR